MLRHRFSPVRSPVRQAVTRMLEHRAGGQATGLRAILSGKAITSPGVTQWRGINQGNWGENYEPDAAIIESYGSNVVRILLRVLGDDYDAGTDSYSSNAADDYLDPTNYAKFNLELDWLSAQPDVWIIIALDSDNAAGNRGLGTADWNLFDTTDTTNQALYKAQFFQMWRRIARDNRARPRVLAYELLPEPMPTGSNSGHAAGLRTFYQEAAENIRSTGDLTTPFLVGPRSSYAVNLLAESLDVTRSDFIYTVDLLTNQVEAEDTFASKIEAVALFRDTNNVPVLFQQLGRNTSEDEGNGTTSDNAGLTAMNGAQSICNAYGIPFTWWQFHQNSVNPGAYALWFKTDAGQNNAGNWTPKPAEIASFTYHMAQTGAALEAAAIAAATAAGADLFYVKSDLSNVWQTNDTSTPVTTVGQNVGRVNAVVGTLNLNQSTIGFRPTLAASVNGYAMLFDATDDWLQLSVTYFASGADGVTIVAGRPPASAAQRVMFHVGTSGSTVRNPFIAVIATDEAQASWRGDDNTLRSCSSTTLCDSRAVVITGEKVGADKKVFLNGVQEGSTDANAVGTMASITRARLGASTAGTNCFGGPITLLCVAPSMTAEQRRAISRWAAWLTGAPFRGAIPA